jgi:hypothetical protein
VIASVISVAGATMMGLAFLLSVLAARGGPSADALTPPHETHVARGAPFALVLEKTGTTALRARLKNGSSRRQPYLHDSRLQPVELIIASPSGTPVTARDERRLMKFDNTLHRNLYAELAPGAEATLLAGEARPRGDGNFVLNWGPFSFVLPPGKYAAHAVFRSAANSWVDENGKRGRIAGLWKGTIESAPVALTLSK